MELLEFFKAEAVRRGLLEAASELDAATVFALVRDMPYRRASNRRPETIVAEWQGTCSGKHHLLRELFAGLGLPSQVMACTAITPVDPDQVPASLKPLYERANRRFVDVHNYLLLSLPDGGRMIVDATWPLSARGKGLVVNETFILGQDQQLAAEPGETWPVPDGGDPQEFKNDLLRKHFTPEELAFREEIIRFLGERASGY